MRQLILKLLASPVLVGSALCYLVTLHPALLQAAELTNRDGTLQSCTIPTASETNLQMTCTRVNTQTGTSVRELIILPRSPQTVQTEENPPLPDDIEALEFTEEESDAAAALFGCDCPVCLNALRQLRNLPPLG